MLKIWFYNKLIEYYKYCRDKWKDIWYETKTDQAKKWAVHYSDKFLHTIKKRDAYKNYISIKKEM